MYGEALYKKSIAMPQGKNVSVSFRVSPRFKYLLQAAASRERRSLTNMLETLLFDYCKENCIEPAGDIQQRFETPEARATK
jgi:hypothetical protein